MGRRQSRIDKTPQTAADHSEAGSNGGVAVNSRKTADDQEDGGAAEMTDGRGQTRNRVSCLPSPCSSTVLSSRTVPRGRSARRGPSDRRGHRCRRRRPVDQSRAEARPAILVAAPAFAPDRERVRGTGGATARGRRRQGERPLRSRAREPGERLQQEEGRGQQASAQQLAAERPSAGPCARQPLLNARQTTPTKAQREERRRDQQRDPSQAEQRRSPRARDQEVGLRHQEEGARACPAPVRRPTGRGRCPRAVVDPGRRRRVSSEAPS